MRMNIIHLPRYDRIVHHWLIWFVLEVRIPPTTKLRGWPLLHILKFLFRGSNLDSSINAVGCQWTGALDIPFLEHLFLDFRISSNEIIEGLHLWLCSVSREGEIVILEVTPYARQVHQGLNACGAQLFWVAHSRPLQNQWGAECTTTNDDLLACSEYPANWLLAIKRFCGDCHDPNCTTILDDHLVHFGIALQVEVRVLGPSTMHIRMRGIAPSSYCEKLEAIGNQKGT